MTKTRYMLSNLLTDLRENLRIFIFATLFVYLCVFYLCDGNKLTEKILCLGNMEDTYFLSVVNPSVDIGKTLNELNKYGKIHWFSLYIAECGEKNINCCVYDHYIFTHLTYDFLNGNAPKNSNEVVISNGMKNEYKIGDQISFRIVSNDGKVVTKTKRVSGILNNNNIFYPIGMGSDSVDILFFEGDGQLFLEETVITIDPDLYTFNDSKRFFLVEPKDEFSESIFRELSLGLGDFYSGEEIISDNIKVLNDLKSKNRVILVSGFTVCISVFLGSIYISLYRKRKEHAIFIMCGATYLEAYMLLLMNNIFSLLSGICFGIILVLISSNINFIEEQIRLWHCMGASGFVIILFIFSCIFITRCWYKKSIVEQLKNESSLGM